MYKMITFYFAALFLVACGNPDSGTSTVVEVGQFNGAEFGYMDKGSLSNDGASITGSGTILFRSPIPEKDNNYALNFALQTNGSATLLVGSTVKMTGAVSLKFLRKADDTLGVTLASGSEFYDLSEDFSAISASGPLSLEVDVHEHGHIVLWVNSEEFEYAFTQKSKGQYWGLTLGSAQLTKAAIGKPKKPH